MRSSLTRILFPSRNAETLVWRAAVVGNAGSVSNQRVLLVDKLISSLKVSGIWIKLDLLYILAAENEPSAAVELVGASPSFNLVKTGTPTFTTDRGYTTSSGNRLTTGWDPATNGVKITQNSAHVAGYVLANGAAGAGFWGVGTAAALQVAVLGNCSARVNSSTSTNANPSTSTAPNYVVGARRSDASNGAVSVDGNAASVNAAASAALSNIDLDIGRANGSASDAQIAIVHVGSEFSDADITNAKSAFDTYLAAIGAI